MRWIKLYEAQEGRLFTKVRRQEYRALIEGNEGDDVWLCTEVGRAYAGPSLPRPGPGLRFDTFDPAPRSLVPDFLRKEHLRPFEEAYRLKYPSNTAPISSKEASAYLGMFSDLIHLGVVVSRRGSEGGRYLLFAKDSVQRRQLVGLMTRGSVETHQITVYAPSTGGCKLTFVEDDWVVVENSRGTKERFQEMGYYKCDGREGVAELLRVIRFDHALYKAWIDGKKRG
jgi:hypothetical protein